MSSDNERLWKLHFLGNTANILELEIDQNENSIRRLRSEVARIRSEMDACNDQSEKVTNDQP